MKPHPPSAASDLLARKTQPKRGWPWRQGPAPSSESSAGYDGAQVVPPDEANGPDHAYSTSPGSTPEAFASPIFGWSEWSRPVRYLRKYPEVESS